LLIIAIRINRVFGGTNSLDLILTVIDWIQSAISALTYIQIVLGNPKSDQGRGATIQQRIRHGWALNYRGGTEHASEQK